MERTLLLFVLSVHHHQQQQQHVQRPAQLESLLLAQKLTQRGTLQIVKVSLMYQAYRLVQSNVFDLGIRVHIPKPHLTHFSITTNKTCHHYSFTAIRESVSITLADIPAIRES